MWKKLLHRSTDALPILHPPSPPLQPYPDHPPLCPAPTGRDQVMRWWAAMWSCLASCFWDVALDKAARMLQTGHHGSGMRGWQSRAPLLSYSTNGWSQCGRSRGGVSRFSYYHLISRSRVPLWYHLSWTPYGGLNSLCRNGHSGAFLWVSGSAESLGCWTQSQNQASLSPSPWGHQAFLPASQSEGSHPEE